tara:strand:- start:3629 stop:3745 length:117 start_codon:yes stop_codon:yes gene_type:complete
MVILAPVTAAGQVVLFKKLRKMEKRLKRIEKMLTELTK